MTEVKIRRTRNPKGKIEGGRPSIKKTGEKVGEGKSTLSKEEAKEKNQMNSTSREGGTSTANTAKSDSVLRGALSEKRLEEKGLGPLVEKGVQA